jgi:hypothetical protein
MDVRILVRRGRDRSAGPEFYRIEAMPPIGGGVVPEIDPVAPIGVAKLFEALIVDEVDRAWHEQQLSDSGRTAFRVLVTADELRAMGFKL